MAQVEEVLTSIGAGSIPVLTVFNKIDRVAAPPSVERDTDGQAVRVWMSAVSGAGLDLLKDCLHERFGALVQRYSLALAPSEGRARARLYRDGLVRQDHPREQGGWLLEVEASRPELEALCGSEGIDFALRVSPCLPLHGFVESGHAAPVESA
jgi:GTP-binding protein HflX